MGKAARRATATVAAIAVAMICAVALVTILPRPASAAELEVGLVVQSTNAKYVKSASSYDSSTGTTVYVANVGGKTFKAASNTVPGTGTPLKYTLTVSEGGKTRTLAKDVYWNFLTNGRYVFYAKGGKWYGPGVYKRMHTLYRLDLNTGKKKRVAKGVNCYADACNGKYLYYATGMVEGVGGQLRALRLSTWKSRLVGKGLCGTVCSGKRIVARQASQNTGYAVYSFGQSGSGKKTLAKSVADCKVKGGKLVYMECRVSTSAGTSTRYRVARCALTGKGRKALSKWSTDWSGTYSVFNRYAS